MESAMSDTAVLLSLLAAAALGAAAGSALTWARLRDRTPRDRRRDEHRPDMQARGSSALPASPVTVTQPAKPVSPAVATAIASPAAAGAVAQAPAWAADVLVVDDSAVARAKLRRLLEAQGYSVQLANDGVEALALLEQGRYALMISDLEMPNMDGVTLIHTCLSRPQTARMPILAISGHEDLRARFNACHDICGVHRKPWVDEVLASHVATLVGPSRASPPHRASAATDGPASPPPARAAVAA
jgi:CheY-like chemotaxis protein